MIAEFIPSTRLLATRLLTAASAAALVACDIGNSGEQARSSDAAPLSIDSPASLSAAVRFTGGSRHTGRIPAPATSSGEPLSGSRELAVTTNSVSEMQFEVPLPDDTARVGAVYLQIDGVDEHFLIPLGDDGRPLAPSPSRPTRSRIAAIDDGAALKTGAQRDACRTTGSPCQRISLSAQPVAAGSWVRGTQSHRATLRAAIIGADDACCAQLLKRSRSGSEQPVDWSPPTPLTISTTPVGSGELQITLTWDSPADIDLHIIEPGDSNLSWASPASAGGGFIDVDDINGFGPENAYYDRAPEAGDYRIEVHHWSGALPANYTVTINRGGKLSSYSGTLSAQRQRDSVTILRQRKE